jgi:hypothetical protein
MQIYFVHKRVCGGKAIPFSFPPLDPKEVLEALRHKSESALGDGSALTDVAHNLNVSPEIVPASDIPLHATFPAHCFSLQSMIRGLGTELGFYEEPSDNSRARGVVRRWLLMLAQQRRYVGGKGTILLEGTANELDAPWWVTSAAAWRACNHEAVPSTLVPFLLSPNVDSPRSYSMFLHAVLIHAALSFRSRQTERALVDVALHRYFVRSLQRLERLVKEIKEEDPEAGAGMEYALKDLPHAVVSM